MADGKQTRGIGPRQCMVLRALLKLDDENRAKESPARFGLHVHQLVRVLAGMANRPPPKPRVTALPLKCFMSIEELMPLVVAGDEEAKELFNLKLHARRLMATRFRPDWSAGRLNQRKDAAWVERSFNPSRILAQLERRGLVRRYGGRGWAKVDLTDEGRATAERM
jgi:hypothetical protein